MGGHEKLLQAILRGASDANIRFEDLRGLLLHLGVEEKINLQRQGSKAKAYQVRQVRVVILKYGLGGNA